MCRCTLHQYLIVHAEVYRKKLNLLQRSLAIHDHVTNSCTCVFGRYCYAILYVDNLGQDFGMGGGGRGGG